MGCAVAKYLDVIDEETSRFYLNESNEDTLDTKHICKFEESLQHILAQKAKDDTNETEPDNVDFKCDLEKDVKNKDTNIYQSIWRIHTNYMAELLLSGYCRDKNMHYRVPDVLMDLIYEYMHHCDTWNVEYNREEVMITDNGTVATLLMHAQHTIYGNHVIEPGENYKWTLKIKSITQPSECILIGLVKNDPNILNKYALSGYWGNKKRKPYDGYLFDGSMIMISPPKGGKYYGASFEKQDDIITMTVHTQSVYYTINGVDYGVAFDDIERCKYRLAMCFVYTGSQIELL